MEVCDNILYAFICILLIIVVLLTIKRKYNLTFTITKKSEQFTEDATTKSSTDNNTKVSDTKVSDTNEILTSSQSNHQSKTDKPDITISKVSSIIEEEVDKKIKEQMDKYITRNNNELEVRNRFNTYNVMLNEPIGRLKQSKLMIDQLVDHDMDRYYGYVKPISINADHKMAYNKDTYCIKCTSKDQAYSNYFYDDPLEYKNDKLEGTKDEISAYNM